MHKTTLAQLKTNGILAVAAIAGATALLAADVAMAEEEAAAYKMVVFSDQRHGAKVAKGNYEKAIAKITAAPERRRDVFETKTNLCVAYTKSGDLENAETNCEAALVYIREKHAAAPSTNAIGLRYEKYLSVALSNRGVLYAVNGDLDSARSTFEEAMELKARISMPKRNLARLDSEQT